MLAFVWNARSRQCSKKYIAEEIWIARCQPHLLAAEGRNVEKLLKHHFVKEERFALPPLAMLAEHRATGAALERLGAAAEQGHKPEAARFAGHVKAHAQQEEEILYPAAILAGRYLKLRQR